MRQTMFIALACTAAAIVATPAWSQTAVGQQPAGEDTASDDPGATIVVTGSRLSNRTVADSPVPVDVIGGDSLRTSGYSETNKVLNQLVPSFNFPQPSLTDGTDSMRPATLRGLAPDQTLVLINGKRRHISALLNLNGSVGRGSSSVDLNEIPPIAIDRIEVLRDGAASLYGSDAIAGVINIELSKRVGIRGTVTYGQYRTHLEGVDAVTGVVTDASGLPVVATAGSSPSGDFLELQTTGKDRVRHDGETVTLATSIGLPVENGYFVFSGQFSDRDPTNRAGADPRRQFVTVGDPRELTFNRYNHRFGDGKSTDYNFFVNAGHDIGASLELYAFGSYGIRDANAAGFYRRSNDPRNRDYGASLTDFVPYYPNGFLPIILSEIEDVSGAVGIRGDVGGGWNADLSVVYGSNALDYGVADSFNTSIGSPDSPRRFDAGGMSAGQTVFNLDLTHPLNVSFMQTLGIAVGGEYRNENFKIRQGEEASYINGPYSAFGAPGGSQVFPGFRPNNAVDVSRDSFAGYVEIDGDVNDALSFQIAGRYEHYSDFGDTLNGKIAARLEIVPGVALRGSASTGFRAPSLAQQYFATTSTNNVGGTLIEVGTFPVSDPVSVALGSKPLKAEKSTNLGGGIVLTPIAGLSLTADYYNIKVRDRVTLTENLQGADVVTILQDAGINNVSSARFFVNGVDTRTQGLDIVGTYHIPDTGFGDLTLTAGYNYNKTKITDRTSLPSLPGLILFGRTESLRLTHGQPRDKINFSADWSLKPVGLTVRTNRYGKVLNPAGSDDLAVGPGDAPGDYTLGAKWVTDIEARINVIEGLELAVGADNVFDVYPDHVPVGGAFGTAGYYLPYSSFSPFGFNGRFLYGRLSINY